MRSKLRDLLLSKPLIARSCNTLCVSDQDVSLDMEYRQEEMNHIWHWRSEYSRWPRNAFNIIRTEKLPPDFKLCSECVSLTERRESPEFDG